MKHPPVKCDPLMLLRAKTANFGGALRLYFAARHIDDGRGVIRLEQLREYLAGYKVSRRMLNYWLNDALDLGIFERWQREKHTFNIVSLTRAAAILGLDHLSKSLMTIPANKLFSKGWHIATWKAYLIANHTTLHTYTDKNGNKVTRRFGNNVSQDTLFRLTGIAPSTQRLYNSKGKVKRRKNIAVSNKLASLETMYDASVTQGRKSAFVFNDPAQAEKGTKYQKVIAWHVPSTTIAKDETIQPIKYGRARKANRALKSNRFRRLSKFAIISNYQHDPGQAQAVKRIFCNNVGQFQQAVKQRERNDIYLLRTFKRMNRTAGVYTTC